MVRTTSLAVAMVAVLAVGACGDDDGGGGDRGDAAPRSDAAPVADAGPGGQWRPLAPMPVDTQETAVVALDGKMYVIGGLVSTNINIDTVWVYDIASDAWSAGPALPVPMHHANAAVVGDTIYVVGALQGATFDAFGGAYALGPSGAWEPRASMPAGTERGSAAVGVIGGVIYLAGGLRGGSVADASTYDPATDQWDSLSPLPEALDHLGGAVVDGVLYAVGGRRGGIGGIKGTVYAYDPAGDSWRTGLAEMPTPRGGLGVGVVDGRIVAVGGEGNPEPGTMGVFDDTEAYDPASDSWQVLDPMPTPRHGMGAVGVGSTLYVPGGATVQGLGEDDTVEAFSPPGAASSPAPTRRN